MERPRCNCRLLAHGPATHVEYCPDCDVVHVHVDTITVRVRPAALRVLRDTLGAAVSRYELLVQDLAACPGAAVRTGREVH